MTRQEIEDFTNRSRLAESVELPGEMARRMAAHLATAPQPTCEPDIETYDAAHEWSPRMARDIAGKLVSCTQPEPLECELTSNLLLWFADQLGSQE